MIKIPKQVEKRNMCTFYVREEDKLFFQKFIDTLNEDSDLRGLADSKHPNRLVSIGIMTAIKMYVALKEHEGVKSSETSN